MLLTTMLDVQDLTTDVLVIGGGVAALRASLAAREAGAEVLICCKGIVGRSGNTVVSTADISAFVPELGTDDSEETFAADTLGSGASIADERLVAILAERSGPAVLDLERLGIPLLRAHGLIDRTRAAGHSRARTYRADSTGLGANKGLALSVPLAERAREWGVRTLDRCPVVHLSASDVELSGAIAVDLAGGSVLRIRAHAAVLAAGGASHLFARTNGTADATGDAISLAMQAGAAARDLEFVQWHPTRMDQPVSLFLTNGLLADGAIFRDASGRPFMQDYDERRDLAPRDVLAKSIYTEIGAGRGVHGGVYLDCSAIPPERVELRHAYLAQTLLAHGVDFPEQWVVVSPSTHFLMGGITIDPAAASTLPGLFVAGESAGGIHGANRLGGNAFCEGLVFGTIAGQNAAGRAGRPGLEVQVPEELTARVQPDAPDPRPALAASWRELREAMWQHASLIRSEASLRHVQGVIDHLRCDVSPLRGRTAAEAARIVDAEAALRCAAAIVAAALWREESRGAHWRGDFPDPSPAWLGHIAMDWPDHVAQPLLTFTPRTP
jgi:fumarate reductase (CoM/CoB) subunit A